MSSRRDQLTSDVNQSVHGLIDGGQESADSVHQSSKGELLNTYLSN